MHFLFRLPGIESSPVSHAGHLISAPGGFLAILLVLLVATRFADGVAAALAADPGQPIEHADLMYPVSRIDSIIDVTAEDPLRSCEPATRNRADDTAGTC